MKRKAAKMKIMLPDHAMIRLVKIYLIKAAMITKKVKIIHYYVVSFRRGARSQISDKDDGKYWEELT